MSETNHYGPAIRAKLLDMCKAPHDEEIAAHADHIYQLLCDAPSVDVAMRQLADVYIVLTQGLLGHFGVKAPRS